MRKVKLLLAMIILFVAAKAQTYNGDRFNAKQSLSLKSKVITDLQTDSLFGSDSKIPTALAITKYFNGVGDKVFPGFLFKVQRTGANTVTAGSDSARLDSFVRVIAAGMGGGGGSSYDSLIFQTKFRSDTSRFNTYSIINSLYNLSRLKSDTVNPNGVLPIWRFTNQPVGWKTSGNTITDDDYLGTNNNKPLKFRVNQFNSGYIDNSTNNIALGKFSHPLNVGYYNTAIGTEALFSQNIASYYNTAVGGTSLYYHQDGNSNTAIGTSAGLDQRKGNYNTYLGAAAGYKVTSGVVSDYNTAIGIGSGHGDNITVFDSLIGRYNTSLGASSGVTNKRDSFTLALGANAVAKNRQMAITDFITSWKSKGISKGIPGYVLTDTTGDGDLTLMPSTSSTTFYNSDGNVNNRLVNYSTLQFSDGGNNKSGLYLSANSDISRLGSFDKSTSFIDVDGSGQVEVGGNLKISPFFSNDVTDQMLTITSSGFVAKRAIAVNAKLDTGAAYLSTVVLSNTGILHNNPTYSYNAAIHQYTISQSLANQLPFTILRRGIGTGTPTFGSIDSSYFGNVFANQVRAAQNNIDISSKLNVASPTATGLLTINGTTQTGSANEGILSLAQTWNTTGNVTGLLMNISQTSSGSNSRVIDLNISGLRMFSVDKNGQGVLRSGLDIGTTASYGFSALGVARARMSSPADAQILFTNNGGNANAAVTSLYQRWGSGSPEGVVTAPVGAFYSRTDGGAGTSFYVKESGTGNTGWVAK